MKVLILDDEPPARRSLKHALSEIGVDDVREAGSIEQAVKLLQEERPDLLCLDVEPVSYTHLTLPTTPYV